MAMQAVHEEMSEAEFEARTGRLMTALGWDAEQQAHIRRIYAGKSKLVFLDQLEAGVVRKTRPRRAPEWEGV